MKKIFFLILALFICSATCSAEFNPPNPERWELFKDTGNILCYFNREAVEITEQPYGRSAKVWVTTYDVTIKIEAMMDWELNLDTEEWRMLSGNIYDEEGNELLATANPEEFKAIPKGSVIEDLYLDLGGREKHTEEPAEGEAKDEDINKGEAETPEEAGEAKDAEKAEPEAPEKAEGADKAAEEPQASGEPAAPAEPAAPEEPAAAPAEQETSAAEDKDINQGEPDKAAEEPQAAPGEPAAPEGPAAAEDKDINRGEPEKAAEESQAAAEEPAAAEDKDINQGEPEKAPETASETADAAAAAGAGVEV